MGTRSVIAEPWGDGFRGRYCHWDGYPSGVGHSLFRAHSERFSGDTDAMVAYLVTDEAVGWSQLAGVDWSLPKGWYDRHDPETPCALCTLPMWRHYAQYYPEGGPEDPMVNGRRRAGLIKPDEVMQLGHSHEGADVAVGPQSYTARGETGEQWIYSDGDDGGTEWAYVLTQRALMVFERRYGPVGADEGHGTGMFGMGASDTENGGHWAFVASIDWERTEVDWEQLDAGVDAGADHGPGCDGPYNCVCAP